jgi:hypothetical protein
LYKIRNWRWGAVQMNETPADCFKLQNQYTRG